MTPREIWNRAALAYGFPLAHDDEGAIEESVLRKRYKGREKQLEMMFRRAMVEVETQSFTAVLREVMRG